MIPKNTELSEDSKAIALLCSDLIECPEAKKFTIEEWRILANRIAHSEIKTPKGFYEIDSSEWGRILEINDKTVERIKKLLSYGIQLGFELERLENRGIWVITRADSIYPRILKSTLKFKAPIVLYGSGDIDILKNKKLAVVGSREIEFEEVEFTKKIVNKATSEGFVIVSGGSRGTDSVAEIAALQFGGKAVSVLSEELESYIQKKEIRDDIAGGKRLVISPYNPRVRFKAYNALGRNKYIYGLSDYSIVISAIENKGGTWSGAIENLKNNISPMFVKYSEDKSGNKRLMSLGVKALDDRVLKESYISTWFDNNAKKDVAIKIKQLGFEEISVVKVEEKEKSIFEVIWPILEKKLSKEINIEQLSEELDVKKVQLVDWLKKAEEKGYVRKLNKPVRYLKV